MWLREGCERTPAIAAFPPPGPSRSRRKHQPHLGRCFPARPDKHRGKLSHGASQEDPGVLDSRHVTPPLFILPISPEGWKHGSAHDRDGETEAHRKPESVAARAVYGQAGNPTRASALPHTVIFRLSSLTTPTPGPPEQRRPRDGGARLRNRPGNGKHLPAPAHGSAEPIARHICLLGYTNTPCCLRTIGAFPSRPPAPGAPALPGKQGGGDGGTEQ